jgi:hypothetical protein
VKCTVFKNSDVADYDWKEDEYYRFTAVKGDEFGGAMGIVPSWNTEVEKLSEAPSAFDDDRERPAPEFAEEIDASTARIALDIEIVTNRDEATLDLDDPEHIELLAIGVGYQPAPGLPVEETVLLREATSPESELELVDEMLRWFDERPADTLLTYNGRNFDFDHLRDRARLAAERAGVPNSDVVSEVATFLNDVEDVDIAPVSQGLHGYGTRLEGACEELSVPVQKTEWDVYQHGLSPEDWREGQWKAMERPPSDDLSDVEAFPSDVPHFGAVFLEGMENRRDAVETRALRRLIVDYTAADIVPLFQLAESPPYCHLATLAK